MSEELNQAAQSADQGSQLADQAGGAAGTQSNQSTDGQAVDLAQLLGEDYAKDPMFKDFKDIRDLAKSFKDTKSMVGKPRYDIPGQDTPPEVVSEFYKKLGVPDTADGYGLKSDANVPEHNNETNAAFLKAFEQTAHGLKLSGAQAVGMQKFFDDLTVKLGEQVTAQQAEEDAQLDGLFEKALGSEKLVASERIKAVIDKAVPADMKQLLGEKLNNEALTAIALIEKHYRETYGLSDKNVGDGGTNAGQTRADLDRQTADLYTQMIKLGMTHPDYPAAREKYEALWKQKNLLK